MPETKSDFDREMSRLEAEIKRLEVEYNMFFAGRLPRLPWETRARVEQIVKRYDRMNVSNTAQRFRFGTLQARFMTFCELWERNLRAKEEGRGARGRTGAIPLPAPPAESLAHANETAASTPPPDEPAELRAKAGDPERVAPKTPPPIAEAAAVTRVESPRPQAPAPQPAPRGGVDTTRIRDVGRDSDRVTALYDELTRARQSTGEAPVPFDRFATVVKAQLAKLGAGGDVDFRVTVSHGKVTLMAKKSDE